MIEHGAYFSRVGEHSFLPQDSCSGAWAPDELHVSPVNGLLIHEMERWLSARPGDGKLVTRISCDYLGVVGFAECEVRWDVLRPGRSVELVEGVPSQNGRAALRARVWRLSASDTSPVRGGELDPLPPLGAGKAFNLSTVSHHSTCGPSTVPIRAALRRGSGRPCRSSMEKHD